MCRDGIVGASLIYPFTHQPRHGQDRIGGPDPLHPASHQGPLFYSSLLVPIPRRSSFLHLCCTPSSSPPPRLSRWFPTLPPSVVVDNYLSPVHHQPRFPIVRVFLLAHRACVSLTIRLCVPLYETTHAVHEQEQNEPGAAILAGDFQVSNRC